MKKFAALVAVLALVAFAAPAFAANPFMDVPMNHWAYDAVSQLASRGVVSGYPDGAFKGEWKATRYEMASVVARALAYVDMNKASKQDLELLKKLVVEFKDELDALGVKVDELDARVAVLEDRVGGWKFTGQFRWTARWTGEDDSYLGNATPWTGGGGGKTVFSLDRFRWNVQKFVDDKTTFTARIENEVLVRAYADITLPWEGAWLRIGLQNIDWGNYAYDFLGFNMNDCPITDFTQNGILFTKTWGMGEVNVFVGHIEAVTPAAVPPAVPNNVDDTYLWGARAKFNFNEQFDFGLHYMAVDPRDNTAGAVAGYQTWWVDAGFKFTPDITFRGTYYSQNLEDPVFVPAAVEDSPNAWRVYLDVKQEALGFTSLWIEYAQYDKHFSFMNNPYGWTMPGFLWGLANYDNTGAFATGNQSYLSQDTTVFNVMAMQKWNEKWGTYIRWAKFEVDAETNAAASLGGTLFNAATVKNWTIAVNYWYTPNTVFELGYDNYKFEQVGTNPVWWDNDDMIWFRTTVMF